MRNKIITLLVILSIFIMPTTASSTLTVKPIQTQITVDGKSITGPFVTYNDTTYVPIRKLCEAAGFTVDYTPGNITVEKDIQNKVFDSQDDNCVYIRSESQNLNLMEEGSGVVYNDMYIITCYHVVKGFEKIIINDNKSAEYTASLYAYDSINDIAILKKSILCMKSTTILGNSDKLSKNDTLIAITSPRGILNTPSLSFVQSTGKTINLYSEKIFPGSSGGGVFNSNGELVGIIQGGPTNASRIKTIMGTKYAIPINKIKPLLSGLE